MRYLKWIQSVWRGWFPTDKQLEVEGYEWGKQQLADGTTLNALEDYACGFGSEVDPFDKGIRRAVFDTRRQALEIMSRMID